MQDKIAAQILDKFVNPDEYGYTWWSVTDFTIDMTIHLTPEEFEYLESIVKLKEKQ